jgi:hypothetical protein
MHHVRHGAHTLRCLWVISGSILAVTYCLVSALSLRAKLERQEVPKDKTDGLRFKAERIAEIPIESQNGPPVHGAVCSRRRMRMGERAQGGQNNFETSQDSAKFSRVMGTHPARNDRVDHVFYGAFIPSHRR